METKSPNHSTSGSQATGSKPSGSNHTINPRLKLALMAPLFFMVIALCLAVILICLASPLVWAFDLSLANAMALVVNQIFLTLIALAIFRYLSKL